MPKLWIFYALCGVYDVSRNYRLNGAILQRYFLGNGLLTWLLSPFNILIDLYARSSQGGSGEKPERLLAVLK